ncbi:MAG TPA: RluA family pseudouridine synthase [Ktedonosporobacter sp.]|jgi:23S rRNA pseudouridine1911/1915/1917 synthase|nr:RluA family pseudouridine synthase [Ktedonosporobacter sp.]
MHHSNELSSEAKHAWHIGPEQVGMRLDRFLVSVLNAVSRTAGQQLIAEGAVLVNGRSAKAGYLLRLNDEVRLLRTGPATISQDVKPQQLPLHIVYEDDDLLVIDKEPGMVVHPAAGHHDDTLVNALLARYPELREFDGEMRPGIVHRLDKDTSGLLIVAKNLRTQAAMIEQMQRHQVEKRYLALVEGLVALDQGSIDAPIGRDPRHRQQMTITAQEGRAARTHFRVQHRYAHHTLLLLQLETGRTHQIRVHLKAIGHPVVGDPVYGSRHSRLQLPLQRQFLHAYHLKFTHPSTGKALAFTAPLPADLQKILARENIL